MARFRFHKGSLADSLATEIQVDSLQEIMLEIYEDGWEAGSLTCEYYGKDDRTDGYPDTYIVTGTYRGRRVPVGFSDGPLRY